MTQSSRPLNEYGLLSDSNSAALVHREGSIDWLCFPRFDGRAVFARLLDPNAGHWVIRPAGEFETRRRYVPGTLVIETTFVTGRGEARLVDAMAFPNGQRSHDLGFSVPHELLRLVDGVSGEIEFLVEFAPRPEYGLSSPLLCPTEEGFRTLGGPDRLAAVAGTSLEIDGSTARGAFTVRPGQRVGFALRWGPAEEGEPKPTAVAMVAGRIEDVIETWRSWEAEHDIYDGPRRDLVKVSSRVLQGLTYRPTGAIVAAPTTSLPEAVGGERNWDYRYAWIRDASLTMDALWIGTCPDEMDDFVSWMVGAAGGHAHKNLPLQIMYGVGGERDLTERVLPHLRGWRGSQPVRIGNGAWTQTQLDIYGEFLNVFALYIDRLGELDDVIHHFIVDLADSAARARHHPDAGMWEVRAEPRHYVSSKLLCWVALDRAVKLASRIGAENRIEEWTRERDLIRDAIIERGWSEKRQSFAQAFGSDELDASVLLMPIYGFLPATEPRMRSTIEAISRELTEDGLVLRYRSHDGLSGNEGTFVICSFWLVSCLAKAGEIDRAEGLFERLIGHANDLGLLAEEIDTRSGELLGNFPQAFSHIGLITAAWDLDRARETHAASGGGP